MQGLLYIRGIEIKTNNNLKQCKMENFIAQSELEGRTEVESFIPFDGKRSKIEFATVVLKTGYHSDYDTGELTYKVMLFESEGVKYYCETK